MLSITPCNTRKEVKCLAKSLAISLEQNGFTQDDLLATATILVDQVIKMVNKDPEKKMSPVPHNHNRYQEKL